MELLSKDCKNNYDIYVQPRKIYHLDTLIKEVYEPYRKNEPCFEYSSLLPYCMRRFGLPNAITDNYKALCCYWVTTKYPHISIQLHISFTGYLRYVNVLFSKDVIGAVNEEFAILGKSSKPELSPNSYAYQQEEVIKEFFIELLRPIYESGGYYYNIFGNCEDDIEKTDGDICDFYLKIYPNLKVLLIERRLVVEN